MSYVRSVSHLIDIIDKWINVCMYLSNYFTPERFAHIDFISKWLRISDLWGRIRVFRLSEKHIRLTLNMYYYVYVEKPMRH